jgi:hypothetical protein
MIFKKKRYHSHARNNNDSEFALSSQKKNSNPSCSMLEGIEFYVH